MGQTEKASKTSWFTGLKQEFQKIVWPDQNTVVKQTVAVVIVSIIVGLIIAILDWIIQYGINFLVDLSI